MSTRPLVRSRAEFIGQTFLKRVREEKSISGSIDKKRTGKEKLTPYQKNKIGAEQAWKCMECRQLLPASFHIDHKIPLRLQPLYPRHDLTTRSNLQALCGTCHIRKTAEENHKHSKQAKKKPQRSKYFDVFGGACDGLF
jgi:5-methylcytosine-specific restriction endonuclease McrA